MVEAECVAHPWDIFKLSIEQIESLPGFAKKSAEKLYNNIQARRSVEFKKFLYAAGLPEIGRHASEDIANKFGSWSLFMEDILSGFKITRTIEGIGDTMIKNMMNYCGLWTRLLTQVKPIAAEAKKSLSPDEIKTFVITGTLEKPRSYYENTIKDAGHKISVSVSKKTSYVLAGEEAGSKLDKANSLGVPVIKTEEELLNIIK